MSATVNGKPVPRVGDMIDCYQIGHTYGKHPATLHCLLTGDDGRCVSVRPATWSYRGVTIERSRVTGYYLANTSRGLTADTLAGMRELIREYPPIN